MSLSLEISENKSSIQGFTGTDENIKGWEIVSDVARKVGTGWTMKAFEYPG